MEDLIEVNFNDFVNDEYVTSQMIMTSLKQQVEVPVFKLNGHTVWGATAMMLSEIKDLLKTVL